MKAFSGFVRSVMVASVLASGWAHAANEGDETASPPSCPIANLQLSDQLATLGVRGANSEFGLALLQQLAPEALQENKNLVTSPYSVSTAMTLLRAGATGTSAKELDKVLGYTSSLKGLSLDDILLGNQLLAKQIAATSGGGSEVKISNALWMGSQFSCNPTYRKRLKEYFSAPVEVVEFGTDPALKKINGQISRDTGGMIDPFLEQTSSSDAAILTNAIYLAGSWETKFDEALTHNAEFALPDNSRKTVNMMSRKDKFRSVKGSNYTSVRLPLAGGKLHVDLILPTKSLDVFIAGLKGDDLSEISSALTAGTEDTFTLQLPRLDLAYSQDLVPAFKRLGLKAPFQQKSGPDFSGMLNGDGGTSINDLYVSLIKHVAKLKLDEKGVTAAAVTGVVMTRSVGRTVRFDRPFLLVIGDSQNNPLFVTAVADPH